jgi:molecular chaperone DnaJ
MNLSFMDAAKGIETPIQISRKETCRTCGGAGTGIDPGSSRITCPVCKGKGRVQRQTGFMKFGTVCGSCGGTGHLPGHPCRSCGGEGRAETTSRLRVRIPAGVDDGSKVRITAKGNAGTEGSPTGDLIIVIHVTPHHLFRRSGMNIELTLPVTYGEAALGAKLEIPTIDGPTMFKIPPGTASGQRLRLKGKGISVPKTGALGDMIVEIKIVPPSTKDIKVRELLKEIERVSPYDPRKDLRS